MDIRQECGILPLALSRTKLQPYSIDIFIGWDEHPYFGNNSSNEREKMKLSLTLKKIISFALSIEKTFK